MAEIVDPFKPTGIVDPFQTTPEPVEDDKQFYDDTLVGEFGEGVVSGVIGIGEGLAGLGAMAVDLAAGTDYGDQVTAGAEALRDAMGLDPEGFVGKGTEIVTQFVVPGLGAANAVAKGAKAARLARGLANTPLTKAERFGLAAKELAAAGLVDAAVSNDNTTTIADWVGMGPTQTEDLIGLKGREKALARLKNRLALGAESTALGGVIQAGLTQGGKTIGDLQVTKDLAGATRQKIDDAGAWIDNLLYKRMTAAPGSAEELGSLSKGLAEAIAFSRYRGFLPENVATRRLLMDGKTQNQLKRADRILKDLESEMDSAIKNTPDTGQIDRVDVMSKVEEYLTQPDPKVKKAILDTLPKGVRQNAIRMRKHVDELSMDVLDSNLLKENFVTESGQSLNDLIKTNLNTYLRRRYRIFEDAKYTPTEESIKTADRFFQGNRESVEKELTDLYRRDVFKEEFSNDFLSKNGLSIDGRGDDARVVVGAKVTDEAAKKARDAFLGRYSIKSRESLAGGYVAKDRLDTGMFASRESIPKPLRQLLGEIDDPRDAYLGTIADLAQFTAVDDYFGSIKDLSKSNSGVGKLFVDGNSLSPAEAKALRDRGYVKLGGTDGASSMVGVVGKIPDEIDKMVNRSGWGSLDGFYVPQSIYKDLTSQVLAEDSFGAKITQATIGTWLKAKGISQYSKTVLSPITQVRNFTTAVSFALANGNMPVIGRGGSLKDSASLVFSNITNKGDDAVFEALTDAYNRGVLGTNAELREVQDILSKGLNLTAGRDPKDFVEATLGERASKTVGKVTKPLEDFYQASDDFWKFFSYEAEQAKIRHALQGVDPEAQIKYLTKNGADISEQAQIALQSKNADAIDILIKDRAAQIVRDTVPNYNKGASGLVRFARKLPVGNFVTFPAEMYRTGVNIVKQSLDDMASDIPAVQARGRQRLLGFSSATAIIPAGVLELGYQVSGVSREEMDAYKRSFAAPWEKGAVLVPIGRTEDGKIQYINFSTSNPYDTLSRFANRAVNEVDDAIAEGKDPGQVLGDVVIGTLGEFFAPFLDEAMLTESLVDISLRGGRTDTGAEVYNPEDDLGTKGSKMFNHVLETLLPNLVPVNVSGGEFEPSRFARGVVGQVAPGLIDPRDKLGRERTLTGEIFRQFSGVSPLEFDPAKGLEFGAYRLQQSQTNAKRMFNSRTDDVNATSNSLYDSFVQANEAKLRVDREYYQFFKDLETMGMSKSEIRRLLKKNNIGGVNAVLRGEFEPFKVTPKNYQEMRDAGTIDLFPRKDIRALQDRLRRMPLKEVREIEAPRTSAPKIVDPFEGIVDPFQSGGLPEMQQGPDFAGPAIAPMPAPAVPQTPQAPARSAPPSPTLLGGNVFDQARNAEIAQRTSG